jgi:D-sedoheptulose 7-phosphate isomerase
MNTMTRAPGALTDLLEEAFDRRRAAASTLIDQAGNLALACRALADRFRAGGRLLTFGIGTAAADAQHVAVEFMHPVIVGKRALPALSLAGDPALLSDVAARAGVDELFAAGVNLFGRAGDIALGIALDSRCPSVARGLRAARGQGLLTLALASGERDGAVPRAAEHRIVIDSSDPLAVKEGLVTAYHVLWELVHVFLEDAA